ncbi:MAG: hypothetical protein ACREBJ_06765 [Nitrosotalea sp.]
MKSNQLGFTIVYIVGFFVLAFFLSNAPLHCDALGECTGNPMGWSNALGTTAFFYIIGSLLYIDHLRSKLQDRKK